MCIQGTEKKDGLLHIESELAAYYTKKQLNKDVIEEAVHRNSMKGCRKLLLSELTKELNRKHNSREISKKMPLLREDITMDISRREFEKWMNSQRIRRSDVLLSEISKDLNETLRKQFENWMSSQRKQKSNDVDDKENKPNSTKEVNVKKKRLSPKKSPKRSPLASLNR